MKKSLFSWKPVSINPLNISKYPKRTKREVRLIDTKPFGDKDRDRLMNWFDCKPMNRKKQDFEHFKNTLMKKQGKLRGAKSTETMDFGGKKMKMKLYTWQTPHGKEFWNQLEKEEKAGLKRYKEKEKEALKEAPLKQLPIDAVLSYQGPPYGGPGTYATFATSPETKFVKEGKITKLKPEAKEGGLRQAHEDFFGDANVKLVEKKLRHAEIMSEYNDPDIEARAFKRRPAMIADLFKIENPEHTDVLSDESVVIEKNPVYIINRMGEKVRKFTLKDTGKVEIDPYGGAQPIEVAGETPLLYEPWMMDSGSILIQTPIEERPFVGSPYIKLATEDQDKIAFHTNPEIEEKVEKEVMEELYGPKPETLKSLDKGGSEKYEEGD